MTTDVVLRFPWGRYHGTPWGRHVNEGAVDWPPSPWRFLRALYATWQFRAPGLDAAVVESLLGKLAAPPSYALPPFTTGATRHYLPGKDYRAGVVLRDGKGKPLPADVDLAVDAFVVVALDAEVRMRWDAELTSDERLALRRLLQQLTYLGRAESLCDAHVSDITDLEGPLDVCPMADESGDPTIEILVPSMPLDIGELTASTTRVRSGDRRRLPAGARSVRYSRPEVATPIAGRRRPQLEAPKVEAVRWSLAGRSLPSRHAAVALGTRLRQRAMKVVDADDRPVPPVLHGKYEARADGTIQHGHAHWIAFGDPEGRQLNTVVAWAPDGFDAELLAGLASVNSVWPGGIPDFGPQRLGLEGWGDIGDVAPELVGPSRVWHSFTPFAPNLHRKKEQPDEEYLLAAVRRELEWRGFPSPVSVLKNDRVPWPAYRTHRPDKERLRDSRRVWGLRVVFDHEVRGPLALGALSHFGLGLFLPER